MSDDEQSARPRRRVVRPGPREALDLGGLPALVHSVHLIAQATDALRHKLSTELRLSAIDVTALVHLYNSPDIRPTDLGRALSMGSAGLTALADRLARAGLLERRPDEVDRRGSRLRLTAQGLRATTWIYDTVADTLQAQLAGGADEPATSMAETLVAVARALDCADPQLRAPALASVPDPAE